LVSTVRRSAYLFLSSSLFAYLLLAVDLFSIQLTL
jgi:hypothetical protein